MTRMDRGQQLTSASRAAIPCTKQRDELLDIEVAYQGPSWLVAEFCAQSLFNGWHLYLRDTDRHQRNADGSWGWLRRGHHLLPIAHAVLSELDIVMRSGGDGSCDDDGYAKLARRCPIRKSRSRGGILVRISGGSMAPLDHRLRLALAVPQ